MTYCWLVAVRLSSAWYVYADSCGLQEHDGAGGGRTVLWAGKLKHRAAGAAGVSTVELLTLSAAVPEVNVLLVECKDACRVNYLLTCKDACRVSCNTG